MAYIPYSEYNYQSYDQMVDAMNGEVVLSVHDNDYQGDSRYLMKDGDRFGVLIFGWGSCSGCDAFEGCDSNEERESLKRDLENSIEWRSLDELIEWLNSHDYEGSWYWRSKEMRDFIKQVFEYLDVVPSDAKIVAWLGNPI